MSIISEIQIAERPAQLTAVIRGTGVAFEELDKFFDSAFGVLGEAIGAGAFTPVGSAFALYRSTPPGPLDLEVGFPVAGGLGVGAAPGSGALGSVAAPGAERQGSEAQIVGSELPAGRYATTTLRGNYDLLGQAWNEFVESVAQQGLEPGMPYWETYVTMPTPEGKPEKMVTELVVPVEG